MSRHIQSNVLKDTKAVKEATFGDILVISFAKEIAFTTVNDTSGLEGAGVISSDAIYKKVEAIFSQPNRINKVSVFGTTQAHTGIKDKLDEMWMKNKNYFFVLMDSFDQDKTKAVIDWALAKNLMPVYLTESATNADTAIEFKETVNAAAIPCATQNEEDYVDAIIVGLMATDTPGRDKWEWKEPAKARVSGFSLADTIKLEEAGINTIQEERDGVIGFFPGKCANGEFIDIEWGAANLRYDIETDFIRAEKAPYKIYHPGVDLRGVAQIEAIVQKEMEIYASDFREFIALDENKKPKALIEVRRVYTEQEIASRIFEVKWTAIPSGSASFGTINGLLTFNEDKIKGSEA